METTDEGTVVPRQLTAPGVSGFAPDRAAAVIEAVLELGEIDGGLDRIAPVLTRLALTVSGADGASVSTVVGSDVGAIAAGGLLDGVTGVVHNSPENSFHGIVLATGTSQVCFDARTDTRVDREACEKLGVRSLAIMPMRQGNYIYALLMLVSGEPGGVTQAAVDLMAPLIRAASIRYARGQAEASASSQLALLREVAEASREVLLAEDPAQHLVDAVARIAGAPHVYLLEPSSPGTLTITHEHGFSMLGRESAADASTFSGTAFSSGRSKVVADWTGHPAASTQLVAALVRGEANDARAGVYVPLVTDQGPVGVVAALLPVVITAANAELLGLLQLLAAEAGIAISRDRLRRRLSDEARSDPLTGLANRRVWNERLTQELARAERSEAAMAVAIIDLDFFKRFNDSFGHPAGDALLAEAAASWRSVLRPTDLLARIGGEEFALLLPDTDLDEARGIAERIGAVVPMDQTASIGLTMLEPGQTAEDAMLRADEALYAAKGNGRNQVATR